MPGLDPQITPAFTHIITILDKLGFYRKGEDTGFQSMTQESSPSSKILILLAIPDLPPPTKIQRVISRISNTLNLTYDHPFEITINNIDFILATLWIIADASGSASMAHPPVDIKVLYTKRDLIK